MYVSLCVVVGWLVVVGDVGDWCCLGGLCMGEVVVDFLWVMELVEV